MGLSGEASQWRVCYQRGLPRLVCKYNLCFKVFKTKRKERASTEGKEDSEEGDWKRLKVGCSITNYNSSLIIFFLFCF